MGRLWLRILASQWDTGMKITRSTFPQTQGGCPFWWLMNLDNNETDLEKKNLLFRVGTRRYMAPEILDNTLKLDSFESFKVAIPRSWSKAPDGDVDNGIMNAGGGHLLPRARLLGGLQAHTLQREKGPRTIIICRIPKHIPMNITKKNQDNTTRSQIIISTVGGRPSTTFPQLGSSRPQPPRYVPGGHLHILISYIHTVGIYQD